LDAHDVVERFLLAKFLFHFDSDLSDAIRIFARLRDIVYSNLICTYANNILNNKRFIHASCSYVPGEPEDPEYLMKETVLRIIFPSCLLRVETSTGLPYPLKIIINNSGI